LGVSFDVGASTDPSSRRVAGIISIDDWIVNGEILKPMNLAVIGPMISIVTWIRGALPNALRPQ
jgi:hypothetical protein